MGQPDRNGDRQSAPECQIALSPPCGYSAKQDLSLEPTRLTIRFVALLGSSASAVLSVNAFQRNALSPSGRQEPRGAGKVLSDRQPSCHLQSNRTTTEYA